MTYLSCPSVFHPPPAYSTPNYPPYLLATLQLLNPDTYTPYLFPWAPIYPFPTPQTSFTIRSPHKPATNLRTSLLPLQLATPNDEFFERSLSITNARLLIVQYFVIIDMISCLLRCYRICNFERMTPPRSGHTCFRLGPQPGNSW